MNNYLIMLFSYTTKTMNCKIYYYCLVYNKKLYYFSSYFAYTEAIGLDCPLITKFVKNRVVFDKGCCYINDEVFMKYFIEERTKEHNLLFNNQ